MLSLKLGYSGDKICTYVFNRQIEHAIPLYLNKWLSNEKNQSSVESQKSVLILTQCVIISLNFSVATNMLAVHCSMMAFKITSAILARKL